MPAAKSASYSVISVQALRQKAVGGRTSGERARDKLPEFSPRFFAVFMAAGRQDLVILFRQTNPSCRGAANITGRLGAENGQIHACPLPVPAGALNPCQVARAARAMVLMVSRRFS